MKHLIIMALAFVSLTGCQAIKNHNPFHKNKQDTLHMTNPASEYCVKQGGKSIITITPDNQDRGVCQLPNGQVVEQWEFYRQNNQ